MNEEYLYKHGMFKKLKDHMRRVIHMNHKFFRKKKKNKTKRKENTATWSTAYAHQESFLESSEDKCFLANCHEIVTKSNKVTLNKGGKSSFV